MWKEGYGRSKAGEGPLNATTASPDMAFSSSASLPSRSPPTSPPPFVSRRLTKVPAAMVARLSQLRTKVAQAAASKHGGACYGEEQAGSIWEPGDLCIYRSTAAPAMEKNKQYVVQPPTMKKWQEN